MRSLDVSANSGSEKTSPTVEKVLNLKSPPIVDVVLVHVPSITFRGNDVVDVYGAKRDCRGA